MQWWTALVLGMVGSLHCAGMCGPLALALPIPGKDRVSLAMGRLAYNGGRLVAYVLLGLSLGLLDEVFLLAGWQRWLSLGAGALVLGSLAFSLGARGTLVARRLVVWLKTRLGAQLKRRSLGSLGLIGLLNGFLPCGLVYAAGAGAVSAGGWMRGLEYMLAFGLGTVPMMLALGLAGSRLQPLLRARGQRLIPICAGLLGLLLILRGLGLGIPGVSPAGDGSCPACVTAP